MVREGAYCPYSISESMHSAEDGQVKQYLTLAPGTLNCLRVVSCLIIYKLYTMILQIM